MDIKVKLEMNEASVLYHGSPYKIEILKPHQAHDTGFDEGNKLAVYATTNRKMAICFAMGSVSDENGDVERIMLPEYGDKMIFKKGHPNYGGKGYLYILSKTNFEHVLGTQWVSYTDVIPIEIIEIDVDDYLDYCIIQH